MLHPIFGSPLCDVCDRLAVALAKTGGEEIPAESSRLAKAFGVASTRDGRAPQNCQARVQFANLWIADANRLREFLHSASDPLE